MINNYIEHGCWVTKGDVGDGLLRTGQRVGRYRWALLRWILRIYGRAGFLLEANVHVHHQVVERVVGHLLLPAVSPRHLLFQIVAMRLLRLLFQSRARAKYWRVSLSVRGWSSENISAAVIGICRRRVDEKLLKASLMLHRATLLEGDLLSQDFFVVGLDLPFVFLEARQIDVE